MRGKFGLALKRNTQQCGGVSMQKESNHLSRAKPNPHNNLANIFFESIVPGKVIIGFVKSTIKNG
jgi:hypothetical protein